MRPRRTAGGDERPPAASRRICIGDLANSSGDSAFTGRRVSPAVRCRTGKNLSIKPLYYANGNLKSGGARDSIYDPENRLISLAGVARRPWFVAASGGNRPPDRKHGADRGAGGAERAGPCHEETRTEAAKQSLVHLVNCHRNSKGGFFGGLMGVTAFKDSLVGEIVHDLCE
jgi:hypothetical protein